MLIDPRDKVKRPSKAKHDERTQRKNELDEFYKETVAPVYPVGVGCTGATAPEQYAVMVPASLVAPDAPVMPRLMHRCNHHATTQREYQVAWTRFFSTG